MRVANLLLLTTLSFFVSNLAIAQSSCSYIIHVDGSTGVDNSGCGAEGTPCYTINYGIGEAVSQGLNDVRVKAGTYNEIVVMQTGVNVWGGYDASWQQTGTSIINGSYSGSLNQYVAVVANGVTGGTILSDFTINAADATLAGKSSYGVHLVSSNVFIQNCIINAGNGSDGTNGSDGSNGTGNANAGANGASGSSIGSCSTSTPAGGAGGTGSGNTAGGNGGAGGAADTDCSGYPFTHNGNPLNGTMGSNAQIYNFPTWGYRGDGGFVCGAGQDGNDGITLHGNGGSGASSSNTLSSNFWVTTTANNGSLGVNGTGGGGGGGGGGCNTGNNQGGGGGGGGAGGLRAPVAGSGGSSGGNSAAIFASSSTLNNLNLIINLGNGGDGGNGGNGGTGALGAPGGIGGAAGGASAASGGDGGDGANGGDSGAGGGGAAGNAFGMYLTNTLATSSNVQYFGGAAGSAGLAGTSANAPGTNGATGSVSNVDGSNYTNNIATNVPSSGTCTEIITADLINLQYCVGDSIWISYNAVGDFLGGNVFNAEMSDGSGSFAAPTIVGTVSSMTSGIIPSYIPLTTPVGSNYKFRVVSTSVASTGSETAPIAINDLPTVSYAISGNNPLCAGESITLTGTGSADVYGWNNSVMDAQSFQPTIPGDYIVTGTNATTGCSNSDTINIVINQPSSNTITVSSCGDYLSAQGNTYTTTGQYDEIYTNAVGCDSTVTIDLTVYTMDSTVTVNNGVYTANGTGTYQWLDCTDGYQPIAGQTNQTFVPTVNGNYAVQITNGACVDTSACNAITNVSLEELSFVHTISVHPNPTSGNLSINFEDVQEAIAINVVTLSGQSVLSGNYLDTKSIELNLDVPNGVYFIHLTSNGDKAAVIRVIKQD